MGMEIGGRSEEGKMKPASVLGVWSLGRVGLGPAKMPVGGGLGLVLFMRADPVNLIDIFSKFPSCPKIAK
jgi:hypothetical protein